jgi:hypothetical protein
MINGVSLYFIIPLVVLVLAAVLAGLGGRAERGTQGALTSFVRVIVYGGALLFVLFLIWAGMYYAGGGH